MAFRVGQKVVCVDETWDTADITQWPIKGCVYTIRQIDATYADGHVGFLLFEIVNDPVEYIEGPEEPTFDITMFRPVKETDISIFTAMLAPTPKQRVRIEG